MSERHWSDSAFEAALRFIDHGDADEPTPPRLCQIIERLKDMEQANHAVGFAAGAKAMREAAINATCRGCHFGIPYVPEIHPGEMNHFHNEDGTHFLCTGYPILRIPDPEPPQ